MISPVDIFQEKIIETPNGSVLHGVKKSSTGFAKFGEAYFSFVDKNSTKGWKKHTRMVLNIVVPIGKIKFVCYDDQNNRYWEHTLGTDNYKRLVVQPGIWMAFRGIDSINMLMNLASIEHDPTECENLNLDEINYDW